MKIMFKAASVIAGFLGALLLSPSVSGADKLDLVLLKQPDVPAECRLVEGTFPVDMQIAILYEHYDTYKKILPPLADKQAQSLRCSKESGTIYYFAFADAESRERAEKFIRPLLWGADHPTGEHPEQIEHGGNLLVVISFKKAPPGILEAIRSKLSGGTKPVATPAPGS
jgi:hypothetical protein